MMKTELYEYCALAFVFLLLPYWAQAQEKKNIVEYGDFSRLKPNGSFAEGWYTSSNSYDSRQGDFWIRPGSSDDRCIRLQPRNGYVLNTNLGGNENLLEVEPGAEYELTVWVKDCNEDSSNNRFDILFDWYAEKGFDEKYRPLVSGEKVKTLTVSFEWQAYRVKVKVPDHIHSAALKLKFLTYYSRMLIDDISMVKTKDAEGGQVAAPIGIKTRAFQHEIEVSWSPVADKTVHWHYQTDGGEIVNLKAETFFILEKLPAGEKRVITIWGVKEGKVSPKVVREVATESFSKGEDDPDRIPYLRTISSSGTCWRYLKTYYNELYNLDARFTYRQNGKEIVPDSNGILNLDWKPTVSEFFDKTELEVTVDEGEGKTWTLTYYLSVSKDPVNY